MPATSDRRAIIMVWDGLRPDYVTPELTPRLHELAAGGVQCVDSHAVFPTVTRCNSASIATGALPREHGIPGNRFAAPDVEPGTVFSSADDRDLERLRAAKHRILEVETLGDALAEAGRRSVVVGTGSPGSALLQHPEVDVHGDLLLNPVLWRGIQPGQLPQALGEMPGRSRPNTEQNAYFTALITEYLLAEHDPALITYWHTDPDHTQHAHGVGHPETLNALRDADVNLGAILDALDRLGLAGQTDVVITSDHGFSTITRPLSILEALLEAGLKRDEESDDVLVADGQVYVRDREPGLVEQVVDVLRRADGVGAIFTGVNGSRVVPGTSDLSLVGHGGELCPDVLVSGAWTDERNDHGFPGTCAAGRGASDGYRATHGSASPWDIRNTLILAGGSFKRGVVSEVPAGNVDIAPTLRYTLGLRDPKHAGRVLVETLRDGPQPEDLDWSRTSIEEDGRGRYQQRLSRSHVGTATYLDYAKVERA